MRVQQFANERGSFSLEFVPFAAPLATVIVGGFLAAQNLAYRNSIQSEIKAVDAKVEAVNTKMNAMDTKMNTMDTKMNTMDTNIRDEIRRCSGKEHVELLKATLENRFEKIESKVERVESNNAKCCMQLDKLRARACSGAMA